MVLNQLGGAAFKEGLIFFGKELGKDAAIYLAKKGIDGSTSYVVDSASTTLSLKKNMDQKYTNISKILISNDANLNQLASAIEDANNIIYFYKHDLENFNFYNPGKTIKYPYLLNQLKKWENQSLKLKKEAYRRLKRTSVKVFKTKIESDFFKDHSNFNSELISYESIKEANNLIVKIKEQYIYNDSTDKDE